MVSFLKDHLRPDWLTPSFQFVEKHQRLCSWRTFENVCYSAWIGCVWEN